ncbi:PREDICTED: uncharacterized protein LOC103339292 [Prunus mume]|uniref:Uncharacterized protein LOC103339292 n=1 Tax=Prunus mume TaxID=102107 RepID=A0ABM0PK63_PRUMU|nr:PREDICTED: uncharacterized protein LOC103339292 [Prunus mume]
MATSNTTRVSLKLLIDTRGCKVLFAEASKDVVDFLFSLLSLPVGTVIWLLSKDGMVGSMGKLYESVENLNDTYLQPNLDKDTLLKPKATVAVGANILPQLTNNINVDSNSKQFYMCSYCNPRHISDVCNTPCPNGYNSISTKVTYVSPQASSSTVVAKSGSGGGYVKGVVTYMVMDNLEVKPMSTISSIAVLNRFSVKDVGALQEVVVYLGMQEHNKVLFAESGKDFVDSLFTFLSLPVGTVIRLLSKKCMVGCLGKLYDSLENLDDTYLQPNLNKEVLLFVPYLENRPKMVLFSKKIY